MQAGLEAELGAGNVEVTGGPGDASGTKPYMITFTGELTGEEVSMLGIWLLLERRNGKDCAQNRQKSRQRRHDRSDRHQCRRSHRWQYGNDQRHVARAAWGRRSKGLGAIRPTRRAWNRQRTSLQQGIADHYLHLHGRDGDRGRVESQDPGRRLAGLPKHLNEGIVTGGGAEMGGSVSSPLTVSDEPAGFGVAPGSVVMATSRVRQARIRTSPPISRSPRSATNRRLATSRTYVRICRQGWWATRSGCRAADGSCAGSRVSS